MRGMQILRIGDDGVAVPRLLTLAEPSGAWSTSRAPAMAAAREAAWVNVISSCATAGAIARSGMRADIRLDLSTGSDVWHVTSRVAGSVTVENDLFTGLGRPVACRLPTAMKAVMKAKCVYARAWAMTVV